MLCKVYVAISSSHIQAGGHVSYLGGCLRVYMSVAELRCLPGLKSNVHELLDLLPKDPTIHPMLDT